MSPGVFCIVADDVEVEETMKGRSRGSWFEYSLAARDSSKCQIWLWHVIRARELGTRLLARGTGM